MNDDVLRTDLFMFKNNFSLIRIKLTSLHGCQQFYFYSSGPPFYLLYLFILKRTVVISNSERKCGTAF